MGNQPTVLLARKDFPANTLQEFAAYVRANRTSVQYGSAGAGSTGHLFCELLNAVLGINNVTHVPYRGGGPAMQDLIGGRYDYICTLSPTGKPLIESNMVKGIAILRPRRSPEIPNLPSTAEQGLPDFEVSTWFGLFFPKGTPEPIVRKLNASLATTLDAPWVERIKYAIRIPTNQVLQDRIGYLLKRPVGRPPNEVRRFYANFTYQAGSWTKPRRVIAKVEWHPGELVPRVGFMLVAAEEALACLH